MSKRHLQKRNKLTKKTPRTPGSGNEEQVPSRSGSSPEASGRKSPEEDTVTVHSSSAVGRRSSSTSRTTSETQSGSFSSTSQLISESASKLRHSIEKFKDKASATLHQIKTASSSQGNARRAFVFVPTSPNLDRGSLRQTVRQFYNTLALARSSDVPEPDANQQTPQPSTSSDQPSLSNVDIVVINCPTEKPGESASLLQRVSNLSASSGSSSSKKQTQPKKGVFGFSNSDLRKTGRGRHTSDSLSSTSRGASSHSGSDFGKGKSRAQPNFRQGARPKTRKPRKSSEEKGSDSTTESSSSLRVIVLNDVAEASLAKRRLSRERGADPEEDDAVSKPARRGSFDGTKRPAAGGHEQRGPPSICVVDSQIPSTSGYVCHHDESDEATASERAPSRDTFESSQTNSQLVARRESWSAGTPTPTFDICPPYYAPPAGPWDNTTDASSLRRKRSNTLPNYLSPADASWDTASEPSSRRGSESLISTPRCKLNFFRDCYQTFLEGFRQPSAPVSDFLENLQNYLLRRIRHPEITAQRYFCIAGLNIWLIVRDPSGDYWFLCGGSHEEQSKEEMSGPQKSMLSSLGRPETTVSPEPSLKHLEKIAKKLKEKSRPRSRTRSRSTPVRPGTSSSDWSSSLASDTMVAIGKFIDMLKVWQPSKVLEPRRDTVDEFGPHITVSYEEGANETEGDVPNLIAPRPTDTDDESEGDVFHDEKSKKND